MHSANPNQFFAGHYINHPDDQISGIVNEIGALQDALKHMLENVIQPISADNEYVLCQVINARNKIKALIETLNDLFVIYGRKGISNE